MTGQTISHYEILEKLGQGGMGVVYKARDTKLDRIVALKFLPAQVARDEETKQRFIQEAKAASSLDDPHICTIYEIGEADDGQLFIAMAYYDGTTLQDLIDKRKVKIDDAASIARQMAKGLGTAHEAGIVHRDVKPANVMITKKGLVKILDFGVAKLSESIDLTREGSTIGTASYMSPEQARGDSLDARSDIWSIGAVLYEMLTGERPFGGGYEAAVAYSIINEVPPPIAPARPDAPDGLIEVVERAMSKEADKRYPTARALADELGVYSGETIVETAPQPAYSPTKQGTTAPSVKKIAVQFSIGAVIVLGIVYTAMMALGLPDWVFPAAAVLTIAGLPIMLYSASVEKNRAKMDSGERDGLKGIKAKLSTKLAMRGGILAGSVLLIAIVGYSVLRAAGIGPFASLITSGELDDQGVIIVTTFENLTEESDLGSTVSEALRIDLSQSTAVRLMDRSAIKSSFERMGLNPDTLLSASLGLQVAQREGVKAIVEGEVSSIGEAFQITARLLSAESGEQLAGFRESAANAAETLPAIDRLSANLRQEIGESLVDIRGNPPLDQVSTSSLEALRHYTKANDLQLVERLADAIDEAERAIELDSLFGMAYRKAAVLRQNAGLNWDRADSLRKRAYDLRHRMTERERLTTEGTVYYYGAGDIDQDRERAAQAYEQMLEKWPDDQTALNNLGLLRNGQERFEEAAELFRRALELGDSQFRRSAFVNNILRQGKFEEFEREADRYDELYPESAYMPTLRRHHAYSLDRLDEAARWNAVVDSIYRADNDHTTLPDPSRRISLLLVQGRYEEATALSNAWIAGPEFQPFLDRMNFPDSLRHVGPLMMQSQIPQAMGDATGDYSEYDSLDAILDEAFQNDDRNFVEDGKLTGWFGYGVYDLFRDKRFEEADSLMAHVDSLVATGMEFRSDNSEQNYRRTRAYIDGMLGRDPDSATQRLHDAIRQKFYRFDYDWIGEIWDLAGNSEKAIEAYTSYVTGIDYTMGGSDGGRGALIHFRLGELHEQQGNTDLAITHFEKMIDRWRDADAILQPQVAEARRRVDSLLDQKARESNE